MTVLGEIRPGYKQTDLGVIPEDWEVSTIGREMKLINGRAFKPSEWAKTGLPIIRIQNLNDPNAEFNYCDDPVEDKNFVKKGDLLFAWSGTLGTSFGARRWLGSDGVLNQHIFKVEPDLGVISSEFALLVLGQVQSSIEKQSHGFKASFVHVKKSDLVRVELSFPSSLVEQQAIATALADADGLIATLEGMVIKKRDLKQAAMQHLLTGKTRLPGFSGAWEVKQLGDVLSVRHGKSQKEVETTGGRYPIFATGGEIGRSDVSLYNKPSVLIGRKGTIDEPRYVGTPFWTIDTLFYTEISARAVPLFIYYKFLAIDWRRHNEASGVPSLSSKTIEKIEIDCPEPVEQTAIAEVLSDMDADLAALEAQAAKARAVKQGMMQELLTGRVRLV